MVDIVCQSLYDGSMGKFFAVYWSFRKLFTRPLFLISLLILVTGVGIYVYTEYKDVSSQLAQIRGDPDAVAKKDVENLVKKIGKLAELPSGEEPTVATVTDVESVREQSFFKNAQDGDRVLIYTRARRAILYRPSINKVIEVAPITLEEQEGLQQEGESSPEEGEDNNEVPEVVEGTKQIKVVLSNGTVNAGLTIIAADDLNENLEDLEVEISSRIDTVVRYENTRIVVLTEGLEDEAQLIAEFFEGSVGSLPEGEVAPDGDILVILGNDYVSE